MRNSILTCYRPTTTFSTENWKHVWHVFCLFVYTKTAYLGIENANFWKWVSKCQFYKTTPWKRQNCENVTACACVLGVRSVGICKYSQNKDAGIQDCVSVLCNILIKVSLENHQPFSNYTSSRETLFDIRQTHTYMYTPTRGFKKCFYVEPMCNDIAFFCYFAGPSKCRLFW